MTKEEVKKISALYEDARALSRKSVELGRLYNSDSSSDVMMNLAIKEYGQYQGVECMVLSREDYDNLIDYSRFVGGNSGINWDLIKIADEDSSETTVENTVEETGYIVNVVWTDGKVSKESVEYGPALYWWPKNTVFMDTFREYSDVASATLFLNGMELEHFTSVTKRTHSNVIDWNDSWD